MAQAFHLARSLSAVAADEPSAEGFARQAKAVLGRSRIFDLRQLEVDCQRECVVLRGSVNSFYHKQLAQELIKTAIDGVEVINDIRVDYSLDRSSDMREWD
jgi:hypothetical protein